MAVMMPLIANGSDVAAPLRARSRLMGRKKTEKP
jgi:hypothetical protein